MEYKKISISDIDIIKRYVDMQTFRTSDFTMGGIYMWIDYFDYQYTIIDDCLVIRAKLEDGFAYSYPLGSGDIDKVFEALLNDNPDELRLSGVTDDGVERLRAHFGDKVTVTETRNWADYVYDYDSLTTLVGKKNAKHRNHVNKFMRLYPDYKFEFIGPDHIDEIEAFIGEYHKGGEESKSSHYELLADKEILKLATMLNQKIGCIKVEGRIVAIAMGEVVKDTLYIHIEKALTSYDGSYAMINKEFASRFDDERIKYINREEDVGDEGLRIAKLNYHPAFLVNKYLVTVRR